MGERNFRRGGALERFETWKLGWGRVGAVQERSGETTGPRHPPQRKAELGIPAQSKQFYNLEQDRLGAEL